MRKPLPRPTALFSAAGMKSAEAAVLEETTTAITLDTSGLRLEEASDSTTIGSDCGDIERQASEPRTLSGASGRFLAAELSKWIQGRRNSSAADSDGGDFSPKDECRFAWERAEWEVHRWWDKPVAPAFNFVYDVLQLSSGRDKFCALMQGYAKFASEVFAEPDSERHWMYRGVEDSLSDGRKIFRLFKEFREVYKMRRGCHRMWQGFDEQGIMSIPAACGCLDVLGHTCSFFYYLFDNLLWAASVGLVRTPSEWQRTMWQGGRRNGPVVSFFGGASSIKQMKNYASIWRLMFAVTANALLLSKALPACAAVRRGRFQGPDDPRLFHTLELVGMAASFRILLSKLKYAKTKSHAHLGLLAIVAALCGIYSNWRKVVRKQCGSKPFVPSVERRQLRLSPGKKT